MWIPEKITWTCWYILLINGICADKLSVVKQTYGNGDVLNLDPRKSNFSGETSDHMLSSITVATFEYEDKVSISCIDFSYDETDNECAYAKGTGITVHQLKLAEDEYITHVRGRASFFAVVKIEFETNKNRIFGPFGRGPNTFTAHHNGAPLLYVDGIKGMWLYSITLVFHSYGVLELNTTAEAVANQTLDKLKYNIEEILDVYNDYKRMLPDVAKKGCYIFQVNQSKEAETSCDLKILLEQLKILSLSVNSLRNRQPRNLLHLKDFDSAKYLDEVKEARDFHNLLMNVRFDLKKVIEATEQLGQNLGNYFKKVAKFDTDIAVKDRLDIQEQLKEIKIGTHIAYEDVTHRLENILLFAWSIAGVEVAERIVRLSLAIAAESNPLKHIFGGTDPAGILDKMEALAIATRRLAKAGTLLDNLHNFVNHMVEISKKFQDNKEQLNGLKDIVDNFDNMNDSLEMNKMAETFIVKYGDYSSKVTNQDLAYTTTLLGTVAEAGCGIIEASGGTVPSIVGLTVETITQDCTYINADIAKLNSYYDEWYSFQFELVDTLTRIVRGNIAQHMANKMSDDIQGIDVMSAAIGSVIVEVKYQAAAQARCNILEYNDGGKRPDVCKKLIFREDDIQRLISYRSSVERPDSNKFAYIPTSKSTSGSTPYINLDRLLMGNLTHFQLPINDMAWMKKYKWLPANYDPETAFFVTEIELYIPGLKCEDDSQTLIRTQTITGQSMYLYPETSTPMHLITQRVITFDYKENILPCAGDLESYPIADSNGTIVSTQTVCVSSKGTVQHQLDQTMPSVFSPFTFRLHLPLCTLIHDGSQGFSPLITVRLKLTEVLVKVPGLPGGIDDCWPNPCPEGHYCQDNRFNYTCVP